MGNKLLRLLGVLITLTAAFYFIRYFFGHFTELNELGLEVADGLLMLPLAALYALGIGTAAVAWNLLLLEFGHKLGMRRAWVIFGKAQFAKYLPGNVAHHAGRVWLARNAGIPVNVCIQTMLIEIVLFLALGISLAGFAIPALPLAMLDGTPLGDYGIYLLIIPALVLVMPVVAPPLAVLVTPLLSDSRFRHVTLAWPGPMTTIRAVTLVLVSFILNGFILDCLGLAVFHLPKSHLVFFIGIYAMSWVAGFIVPGAPAGLGVREAIMLAVLGPMFGPGVAIGLSIAARLVTTLGDLIAFLLATLLGSHLASPPQGSARA